MELREAAKSDIPVLLELEQRVIEYERPFNASIKGDGASYYDLPSLISSQNSCLTVVEAGNEIIGTGYALIQKSKEALSHENHSYLGFMFVSPEQRGKGVNQMVMNYLIQWSKGKGITDFYLDVYSQNKSAIKAYEKAGFEPCLVEMKLCL